MVEEFTDDDAVKLYRLLNKYVTVFGGPDENKGEINPHKMTLAELSEDLVNSTPQLLNN